jgi:hypothetical protein
MHKENQKILTCYKKVNINLKRSLYLFNEFFETTVKLNYLYPLNLL